MKKILVLGASGFIGSHFCKIAKKSYDVIPLIRNRIKSKNSFLKLNPDLKKKVVVYKGIDDLNVIKKILKKKISFIINFSAYGVLFKSDNNLFKFYKINFFGVLKLVELLKSFKIERYVHIGTISELQISKKNPSYFINNYSKNHYSLSKLFASIYIENIVDKIKVPFNIVTLFPVFGPYENEKKLIPYVIKNLKRKKEVYLTSGKQKRYYAYVDDVAQKLIRIISKKKIEIKIFLY
jgi:nucleoside-diphosphate-sugar epimerase